MATCNSCGGIIGRDCFNTAECAEIGYQQEQQLRQDVQRLMSASEALRRLEAENAKLKHELEINTQEIDSYGEPGSDFRICSYCKSESGAGVLDVGIPHDEDCILFINQ